MRRGLIMFADEPKPHALLWPVALISVLSNSAMLLLGYHYIRHYDTPGALNDWAPSLFGAEFLTAIWSTFTWGRRVGEYWMQKRAYDLLEATKDEGVQGPK